MKSFFRSSPLLALALIFSLMGNLIPATAESTASLDKHSRKIQHKLEKYKQGTYLHLTMGDSSEAYGTLGHLSATSFTFNASENNALTTVNYGDVSKVKEETERVGRGAEPFHMRHMVPILITAGVIAAGAITYAAIE
jgi:hypothetical protein